MPLSSHPLAWIVCSFVLAFAAAADGRLRVAYEWKEMDFKYASVEERWSAIERHEFKPNNVIPFGLEVYGSRLFLTLPRWRDGVPASLAYIDLNDNSTQSPLLIPFPSWQAHNMADPELVSPFRAQADRCGRLWVLDSRIDGVLDRGKLFGPSQMLIYDLHNDNLLRRHIFPEDHMKEGSFFSSLAIEDSDCDNTFAYAGDLGAPGLVVYSWRQEDSWRITHHYFHPDPLAGNYSIDGIDFQWDDGVYGLALSKPNVEGYAILYFHPLSSVMEFTVSTKILRNKTLSTSGKIYGDFKVLGSRGPNMQAGASFYDHASDVLFYAIPNLNAIGCWKTSNNDYTNESQGNVYTSPVELVFPSEVKVDNQGRLWVLSNRLQDFIYNELYPTAVNFRILTAPVKEAIKDTACDSKPEPLPDIVTKLGGILKKVSTDPVTTEKPINSSAAMLIAGIRSVMALGLIGALAAHLLRL